MNQSPSEATSSTPIAPFRNPVQGPACSCSRRSSASTTTSGRSPTGWLRAGYVTLAPDMFWRIDRRYERKDESGMGDAFAIVQQLDFEKAAEDIQATHAHLVGMPECTGKIGAVGFCLGGALAFMAATRSRVDGRGIDAAVCYYGSAINDMLGHVSGLQCPSMYHYGSLDAVITPEDRPGRGGIVRAARSRVPPLHARAMRSATGTPRRCTTRRPPTGLDRTGLLRPPSLRAACSPSYRRPAAFISRRPIQRVVAAAGRVPLRGASQRLRPEATRQNHRVRQRQDEGCQSHSLTTQMRQSKSGWRK